MLENGLHGSFCQLLLISYSVISEEVREYFGQFGQVKKCLLPFVSCVSVWLSVCLSVVVSVGLRVI